ncbi:MAG: 30S ribosomal protein S15 [Candidatus Aenigmarchaeota archaeon]|nr:30S ribosomal protein S15 [Candidatus Aenigmarchaeota archaeon]
MARMHSRKHGKSKSKRPVRKSAPKWVRYSKQEVEKLIIKLAKEGTTSAKIGIILRDQYGIPLVREVVKEGVQKVLKENGIIKAIPEDMISLMKKAVKVRDHLGRNKKDTAAIHGLELLESKIRRLSKYYRRTGDLPKVWKYDPAQAKLMAGA